MSGFASLKGKVTASTQPNPAAAAAPPLPAWGSLDHPLRQPPATTGPGMAVTPRARMPQAQGNGGGRGATHRHRGAKGSALRGTAPAQLQSPWDRSHHRRPASPRSARREAGPARRHTTHPPALAHGVPGPTGAARILPGGSALRTAEVRGE